MPFQLFRAEQNVMHITCNDMPETTAQYTENIGKYCLFILSNESNHCSQVKEFLFFDNKKHMVRLDE